MPPNAKWQLHREMTPTEYRLILIDLGLSISAAARYLGVSKRTSQRYTKGLAEIPAATALLLQAVRAYKTPLVVPKRTLPDH